MPTTKLMPYDNSTEITCFNEVITSKYTIHTPLNNYSHITFGYVQYSLLDLNKFSIYSHIFLCVVLNNVAAIHLFHLCDYRWAPRVWCQFAYRPIIDVSTTCLSTSSNDRKLQNIITHNVIWTNQNNELYVFRWQRAHQLCDVTCFPAFEHRMSFQAFCRYMYMYVNCLHVADMP